MKHDVYIKENHEQSTYYEERGVVCHSNIIALKQYKRIENDVCEVENISELAKMYEIKVLDNETGLHELKLANLRVIHFLYKDELFVFLGTFVKKSNKTPPNQIETNNNRLKDYVNRRKNDGEE